jgi:hypothetical protein
MRAYASASSSSIAMACALELPAPLASACAARSRFRSGSASKLARATATSRSEYGRKLSSAPMWSGQRSNAICSRPVARDSRGTHSSTPHSQFAICSRSGSGKTLLFGKPHAVGDVLWLPT